MQMPVDIKTICGLSIGIDKYLFTIEYKGTTTRILPVQQNI